MHRQCRNLSDRLDGRSKSGSRRRRTRSSFIPPSKAIVDPLPSQPTHYDPNQRVIARIDRPVLKLYLHILPCGEAKQSSEDATTQSVNTSVQPSRSYFDRSRLKARARKLGDRVIRPPKQLQLYRPEPLVTVSTGTPASEDVQLNGLFDPERCHEMYLALVDNRLTLADFRPLEAPFVPEAIKILVNAIELGCYSSDWDQIFVTYDNLSEMADMYACVLLQNWNQKNCLKRQITALSLPMKIAVLRSILSGFKQKPLHFSRRLLLDIIQRPLFDQFLRPNPKMKSIIKRAVLPCNRTTMDTLSFLMLHLLHAWEYASNPLAAKLKLSKIYGPLLVSFAERPVVLDQDPSGFKTEEGAILEVVLEECNSQFWDNLGMSQLRRAFKSRTRLEKMAIERGRLSVIEADEQSDVEKEAWFTYLICKQKEAVRENAGAGDKGRKPSKGGKRLSAKEAVRKQCGVTVEHDASSWVKESFARDLKTAVHAPTVSFLPCKDPVCG